MGDLHSKYGRVGVVFGGTSSEREVSLNSGNAVYQALLRAGVDALPIDVGENPLDDIKAANVDRVFVVLHGPVGEDGTLQGALEVMGMPYTGSGVLASALAMDKWRCKLMWRGMDLPTADFALLNENADWATYLDNLGGKVMVKPINEGSSFGMSPASSAAELQAAWQNAAQYGQVIAEKWNSGDEFTIAVLNGQVLPPIRVVTAGGFYDYQAKYVSNETQYLIPCGLDETCETELKALVLQAFNSLNCKGWGRVDVMVDGAGDFQILEANTIPGMTDHSLVPKAAAAAGITMEQLVVAILDTSLINGSGC
jgi:D-alanine-D-alanine ligase